MPTVPTLLSSFTGADENPLSEGGNWAQLNTNTASWHLKRVSNAATSNFGFNGSYWTPANFGPDLEAYATLAISSGSLTVVMKIAFRVQGEGGSDTWDGYTVEGSGTSATGNIRRVTNAVSTSIGNGSTSGVWGDGDKMGVRCVGSEIKLWRLPNGNSAWELVCSATDATYALAGKLALFAHTTTTIDDFYAGTDTSLFTYNDVPALSGIDFSRFPKPPLVRS